MNALSDHHVDTLANVLGERGFNPANAAKVLRKYWKQDGEIDISSIAIARPARAWIAENLLPWHSHVLRRHQSVDGTMKLLVGFADQLAIRQSPHADPLPEHGGDRRTPFGLRMDLNESNRTSRPNPSPRYSGERMGEGLELELRNEAPHPASPLSTGARGTFSRHLDVFEKVSSVQEHRERELGRGAVECVLMPSHRPDRAAACISSQIGCAMGCDFCASTKSGLERNLCVGEIVEQFIHLRIEARKQNRRIASLVFMGMGEPMHNLDHVIPAIRILAEPGLGALGNRAITVSTVGVVPGIDRLAEADLGVHLALSLHAPDDETRSRLVPMNRKWSVKEILDAARRYQHRVGRPVNIEYCMLGGVNDSDAQATLLGEFMHDFRAHVNLIPYNSIGAGVSGNVYQRPGDERIGRFARILREKGVVAHIRQTRGDDVAAACGQLRLASRAAH